MTKRDRGEASNAVKEEAIHCIVFQRDKKRGTKALCGSRASDEAMSMGAHMLNMHTGCIRRCIHATKMVVRNNVQDSEMTEVILQAKNS